MRHRLLAACLTVAACDPFGLGSPAALAPHDGGDTGASDTGPDASVVATPLLFYRADTGEVALLDLGDTGRLDARRSASLAPGLTHLVALGNDRLVTYDAASGARAVLSVDVASARFVPLSSDKAPGFTALASLGGGRLLSYRATTGTLRVDALVGTSMGKVAEYTGGDELVGHDELVATRAGPFLLYTRTAWRAWIGGWSPGASAPAGVAHADISQGWSHITAVAKTHLFFYVSDGPGIGNAAFTQIDATGADLDFLLWDADRPLPIGRDAWSHVVGGPRAMLFYRSEDGAVRTATIATDEDLRFVFLELTPTPPPVVGKGWTHVTSLQ
ncbi:MAG: hypothetical protein IPJ34_07270 [Myxococcales bacterium]|nr:hypothetical protein [Myxococcales bacterium]